MALASFTLGGELACVHCAARYRSLSVRSASLRTHSKAQRGRQAVDLTLDGKQLIDALDGLDGNRHLLIRASSKNLRRLCPARGLDDRTRAGGCAAESRLNPA